MEREERIKLIRIIVATVMTAVTMIAKPEGFPGFLLVLAPYLTVGYDVIAEAVRGLMKGEVLDEHFLMFLASVGALGIGKYFEAVAVMLFYQIGELFQDMAVEKSRRSITELMDVRPEQARLLTEEGEETVLPPHEVSVGERVTVYPGERIPLDGVVTDGTSAVDTKSLTGESVPQEARAGSKVFAGCVNISGRLTVKVTKPYEDSAVAEMLKLVEQSAEHKAGAEQTVHRFARYYTPIVVGAAGVIAVIPTLISALYGHFTTDFLNAALVFLVVSCPCALVISVPLSYFAGIGAASRHGVLIKGADTLEALSSVKTVLLDKTGTLTEGRFSVSEVVAESPYTKEDFLTLAALAERSSTHPIALALQAAAPCDLSKKKVDSVQELPGKGVVGVIGGHKVAVGNARMLREIGLSGRTASSLDTTVYLAIDGKYAGYAALCDRVKENAAQTVAELKENGVKTVAMLTGDKREIAEKIGREVGVDSVEAELLPAGKVLLCKTYQTKAQEEGGTVLFVGDGLNDAPVLGLADIGAAMGGLGSDAAIESADLVIMQDDLSRLPYALRLAGKVKRIVKENISVSLFAKFLVMLLGLMRIGSGWILWAAVFADVGVTVLAVLNAVRLLILNKK